MQKPFTTTCLFIILSLCFSTGAQEQTPEVSAESYQYYSALELYKKQNYNAAQREFEKFVENNPDHGLRPSAQFYSIKCDLGMKDFDAFDRKIIELETREPNHPSLDDLLFAKGTSKIDQKKWDESLEVFDKFSTRFPESPYLDSVEKNITECHAGKDYATALEIYESGQFEDSRMAFDLFLSRYPENWRIPSVEFHALKCIFETKNYDLFIQEARHFCNTRPEHPSIDDLNFCMGVARMKQEKWDEAKEIFEGFEKRFPDSPHCGNIDKHILECNAGKNYANALKLFQNKRFKEAQEAFQSFLQNFKGNWRYDLAQFYGVKCLYTMGLFKEFLIESQAVVQENYKKSFVDDLLCLQALSNIKLGNGPEARKIVDNLNFEFPQSNNRDYTIQLFLDSYLCTKDFDPLTSRSQELFLLKEQCEKRLDFSKKLVVDDVNEKYKWYHINIYYMVKILNKFQRTDHGKEYFRLERPSVDSDTRFYLIWASAYSTYLLDNKLIDDAIEVSDTALAQTVAKSKERRELQGIAAKINMQKGDFEKGRIILMEK